MILLIDPGFSNFGYVVINDYGSPIDLGVLNTAKSKKKMVKVSDDTAARIEHLAVQFKDLIKQHSIKAVLGELPSGGALSANAMKAMAIALAVPVVVCALNKLPIEWATPEEVKMALTGRNNASKQAMMQAVCNKLGWKITLKQVKLKSGKIRYDNIYWPLGIKMGSGKFEHVADSIGVGVALKNSNIAKMYVKKLKR